MGIVALRFYKYFAPLGLKSTNAKCPYFKLKKPKKNVPVGGQFAPLRILVFSTKNTVSIGVSASQKIKINLMTLCERDSSGTTERQGRSPKP
jgi:hypothetical protein